MQYLGKFPVIETGDEYQSDSVVVDLSKVQEGMKFRGLALLTEYSRIFDPSSKAPMSGYFHFRGFRLKLKQWKDSVQDLLNTTDVALPIIIEAEFTVGSFNGELDMKIDNLIAFRRDLAVRNFERSVDLPKVWEEFKTHLQTHLTQAEYDLFVEVVQKENILLPFQTSYAGKVMHDAQVGGLMLHELKMLRILEVLFLNDPRLLEYAQVLRLGILFHDIAKVYEMGSFGQYTDIGFASHRLIGIEILTRYKDSIVNLTGDHMLFYHLMAIMSGHHGDFADKPTTVWAKVIHQIDMLEANTTGLLDSIQFNRVKEKNGHNVIYDNGSSLVVW